MRPPEPIPFPLSSFPGANVQESSGRLINGYVEPLGEGKFFKWIRSAGLTQLAATGNSGYRGGMTVDGLAYECWAGNASTVDSAGVVTSIGDLLGTSKVSIAQNQASPVPDVVVVDPEVGAFVIASATVLAATSTATISSEAIGRVTATIGGTVFNASDIVALTFTNSAIAGFPISIPYTLVSGDTADTIATKLTTAINASTALSTAGLTATSSTSVISITQNNANAASTVVSRTITTGTETVTFAPTSGAMTEYFAGDIVALTVLNPNIATFPVSVSYTLVAGDTPASIAAALKTAINANSVLAAVYFTATSAAAVITFSQEGSIGNGTSVVAGITNGNETVTFSPASGYLTGGQGTQGAFTGAPTAYNGFGALPAPNSVTFQDGYLFFSTGGGQVYATPINGLLMNALTYVTIQGKADVNLLRVVAYSGYLLCFTTGSCEVWQDAANPAPNFPYSRISILDFGLAQTTAIAGFETGFSQLLWVGQDNGVYLLADGSLGQAKVSPPDLDRLIEAQIVAGNTLEAGCYISNGKKFWTLSCPDWTWEFNLTTKKWNERWSLLNGLYGRWRATGGHPAFGRWVMGDEQSGSILYVDDTNFTEVGAVQLWRMESGPVSKFPERTRIARADFNFVAGVGQATGSLAVAVTGAAAGAGGYIALAVLSTSQMASGDSVMVSGVAGTVEANGTWPVTVIDGTHILLNGSDYANAYTSGGTVTDLTVPANVSNPSVQISMSKDGGNNWGNPLIRSLGSQGKSLRSVVSVSNMGLAGNMGSRWRLDVTDQVYVSFFGATQSSELRPVGG